MAIVEVLARSWYSLRWIKWIWYFLPDRLHMHTPRELVTDDEPFSTNLDTEKSEKSGSVVKV
jgi:hypothetical protein